MSPGASTNGSGSTARADSPASQVPQLHKRLPPAGTWTTVWHLVQVTETVSVFIGSESCWRRWFKRLLGTFIIMLPDVRSQVTRYSQAARQNLRQRRTSPRGSAILTETLGKEGTHGSLRSVPVRQRQEIQVVLPAHLRRHQPRLPARRTRPAR